MRAVKEYQSLFGQHDFTCTGIPDAGGNRESGTLSTAAKAGIGVSVAVVVAAVLFGGAIIVYKKRQNKSNSNREVDSTAAMLRTIQKAELDEDAARKELQAPHGASEMEVEERRQELP